MAQSLGVEVDVITGDWRRGVDGKSLIEKLSTDSQHEIKAVAVVHNETSGGVTSRIDWIREAIDTCKHPALLIVDAVSSLGSIDYRHEEWGVDVTIAASQKGLMLPPGLCFNALSSKAIAASQDAGLARVVWDWRPMLAANREGFFPYTPSTNLLYGLHEALIMLEEEGLENVFVRHQRLAEATRQTVSAWGLEIFCRDSAEYSNSLTAVQVPKGSDADLLMQIALKDFDLSLGTGLGKLQGKIFRIGHLGSLNELTLLGVLCGIEMTLQIANIPFRKGGINAALEFLRSRKC